MRALIRSRKSAPSVSYEQRGSLHFVIPILVVALVAVIGTVLFVFSSASPNPCPPTSGQKESSLVATTARRQWCLWNHNGTDSKGVYPSHGTLLSWYTDGSPSEDWCADFVSYVYQAAGYPFRRGVNGWDIKAAASLANVITLKKEPASYSPNVGDIVYLKGSDYPAGHVEIVVETKPLTFLYGNSGTRDPATGNGQMKEGPKPTDIQYYLTPS